MEQDRIIEQITALARRILPQGASLWLYGSRARGDAHPGSDYDLLILLDKGQITCDDHDKYGFPLRELGWDYNVDVSPHLYPREAWQSWDYSPFYKNVEHDKIILV